MTQPLKKYDYMAKPGNGSERVNKSGRRNCLCCGSGFISSDTTNIRICKRCKTTDNYREGTNFYW